MLFTLCRPVCRPACRVHLPARAVAVLLFILFAVPVLTGCSDTPEKTQPAAETESFDTVVQRARGTTVRFYMWGGSAQVNAWVDGYVSDRMKELYDITVQRVPMDAPVFVNKLLTEKAAGKQTGTIDLMWINGENFRNARESGVLYGPFAGRLPNMRYVDAAAVATDFGYPVQEYEAPLGRAQFVFEYDTARVSSPPASFDELRSWIREHPGRFTYPQPPDFTGSAFVRQVFYAVTGGHAQYMTDFDGGLWDRQAPALWLWLNEIKPFMWQQGVSMPKDPAALDTLFARGEVDFSMAYHPSHAQSKILEGTYPDTVRTFVMQDGSLYNTHFTAIAFNAPNKAGAMVLADFLLSPQAQAHKLSPANWGDFPVLEMDRLSEADRELFSAVKQGAATLPPEKLAEHAVPEIPALWLEAIEEGWDRHVLRQNRQ